MSISREGVLRRLGVRQEPTNEERRERLFRQTGVWVESLGKAAKNYHSVATVTDRIQSMDVDLSHLRRAPTVSPD